MKHFIHTIQHTARAAAVLLIALCAAQTAWAWSGQGTEANPYKIANASDLRQLATDVNKGTTYENVYFRQTADIDMAGEAMTPIGNDDHPFMGHYDGYNYTISHLTITGSTLAALFGHANGISQGPTYHPSSLKNIVLTDCNIDVSSVTNSYAAGICAKNGSYNTVENCRVAGTIKGNYAAGGIVGYENQGNVKNCFADVTVTASVQQLPYGNHSTYCSVGKIIGFVVTLGNAVTGNYYRNDGATDGTNAAITAIGRLSSTTYPTTNTPPPSIPTAAPAASPSAAARPSSASMAPTTPPKARPTPSTTLRAGTSSATFSTTTKPTTASAARPSASAPTSPSAAWRAAVATTSAARSTDRSTR